MPGPNVIFILLDDFGWRDLACYGSSFYETPRLDALASQGIVFSDAYAAAPVCSPSRASLLTGRYPARVGVTDWIDVNYSVHPCKGQLIDAPYTRQLPLEEFNLARAFQMAGYATWHVGKWHLGREEFYPEHQGFDINIGGGHQGHPWQGYFSPWGLHNLPEGDEGEYLTDRLTDEAVRLIQRQPPDQPFFLNLWHYAVHTPIQAKPEDIARFTAKAQALGLDQINPFEEGEFFPTQHKRHLRVVRRTIQSDPVYAAMIYNLDWNIGRLVDCLTQTGRLENTLIVFTSDNGGLATAESSPTCNAPLAEGKGWMYEGGNRVPLFFHWSGVISPNQTCRVPFTSPDLYPTLLEMAGIPLKPRQHCDGVSFAALLRGQAALERGPIFWHYPHYGNQGGTPSGAVRLGSYKLVEFFEQNRLALFHLADDLSERRDLAAELPDKTLELHRLLQDWRLQVGGRMPQPNPGWESDLPHQ